MRCNCESQGPHCARNHKPGACKRSANEGKRLQYVGAVCWECWHASPAQYRINPSTNPQNTEGK